MSEFHFKNHVYGNDRRLHSDFRKKNVFIKQTFQRVVQRKNSS